jgi:hypothetical protein
MKSVAIFEPCTPSLQLAINVVVAQPSQHRQARRGRQRIPGQRSRLIHVAARRQPVHHVRASAERRERQAAADDLPEDRQVRTDVVELLRTAPRDAEAGDHLVEDQQRSGSVAQPAQRGEEAALGRNDPHVPRDRLHDDRGKTFAVACNRLGDRVDVVVRRDDRVLGDPRRHARRRRNAERREA